MSVAPAEASADEKVVGVLDRPNSSSSAKSGHVKTGADDVPVTNAIKEQWGETQRGLSPRHVQLMAIGGSIGVGIWVRSTPVLFVMGVVMLTLLVV